MLKIYGSSDDLIEVEGHIREEYYVSDPVPTVLQIANTDGDALIVTFVYGRYDNTWSAEVSQVTEDAPIPWPVTITAEPDSYTVAVNIDCPDDTTIQQIECDDGDTR